LLHSCAHFRHASAQRENARSSNAFSAALASSSAGLRADGANRVGVLPSPAPVIASSTVAIRAQSRAVTITDATVFTSGWASPAGDQPFTTPPRHITSIDRITEFWWPHSFSPEKVSLFGQ